MDLKDVINQLTKEFYNSDKGQRYKKRLESLDDEHKKLVVKVNNLAQQKRSNRREYKKLLEDVESKKNDFIVEGLTKVK